MIFKKNNFLNSLKNRLFFSALLMIFVLLPLVGVIISQSYQKHMISGIKNELSAYSYSILAVIEVEENHLLVPEQLVETEFNVSQSGLYALITSPSFQTDDKKELLWSSQSFLSPWHSNAYQYPQMGGSTLYQVTLEGNEHFVYSISVSFGDEKTPYPITLHILKQRTQLDTMITEFHQQLFIGLSALLVFLLIFQYLWSVWTLKPLQYLQHEVKSIEQGESTKLIGNYPTELLNVTNQLNLLLHTEQKQRQRYRNALSDLAHSLKTPLAVIQSQENLSKLTQEQTSIINVMIDHQLRKAQTGANSSWHLGTLVLPVVISIEESLEKIYKNKAIRFHYNIEDSIVFKGDKADLIEILGNLLDNAFKAASREVLLTIKTNKENMMMMIEDDGMGISEQNREEILKRGTRADTYQAGHGIGLAIVRDLLNSYEGAITITDSKIFKGAKFIITLPISS